MAVPLTFRLREAQNSPMAAAENVITKTNDLIQWFLPKIEKFPRNYKFLVGDRLVLHKREAGEA